MLTLRCRLMHAFVSKLDPEEATSHYLNQWWFIFHWTISNIFQLNLNLNTLIEFQNVVCKMATFVAQPQRVLSLQLNWRSDIEMYPIPITVTSLWARWRLKSSASWLFTEPFVQAQIKENIKAPCHWPLWRNSPVTAQRANNAENISIWWRHHENTHRNQLFYRSY